MLTNPCEKYSPYPPIALPDRRWPERQITTAPRWLSTDLRDGNQALAEPMDAARKLQFWDLLLECGFKEIEVAFPSASQTDFNFVRQLIEEQRIPEDVTIQVLTQAREELIARTFEALRGARQATIHLYNATAPLFRELVFGMEKAEVIELAPAPPGLFVSIASSSRTPVGNMNIHRKPSVLPSRNSPLKSAKRWRKSGSPVANGQ